LIRFINGSRTFYVFSDVDPGGVPDAPADTLLFAQVLTHLQTAQLAVTEFGPEGNNLAIWQVLSGVSFMTGDGPITSYNFTSDSLAPVPEPTTMIAGALLLLPFGASTLRIIRKNRKA
jgi:hypothetical protein